VAARWECGQPDPRDVSEAEADASSALTRGLELALRLAAQEAARLVSLLAEIGEIRVRDDRRDLTATAASAASLR
jgi:hypothetical protein